MVVRWLLPLVLVTLLVALAQPLQAADTVDLTAQELSFLQQHPSFRAHVEQDYRPFIYVDKGEAHGFTVDLTNIIAKRLGIKINYVIDESWEEALINLKNHHIDMVIAMVNSEQRRGFAHFTKPILVTHTGIATRKDEPIGKTINDFNGRQVAVVDGYWHLAVLQQHYPQIIPVKYTDHIECLEALATGEVDAVISTNPVLDYQIRSNFMLGLQTMPLLNLNHFSSTKESYGVRRDFPFLVSALQKGFDSITEKELNELRQRWLIQDITKSGSMVLNEQERQHLLNMQELRLCIDPAWMPMEGIDHQGSHVGLSADYFAQLQRLLPIPIRLLPTTSWLETLDKAKKGECDLISLITQTEERDSFLNFTRHYLSLPVVVATRDKEIFIENMQQLVGRRIGSTKGYSVTERFRHKYPTIDLIEVDNVATGVKMVHLGEIYGFIGSVAAIGQEIRDQGFNDVKISGQVDIKHKLRVGVRKDDPLLLSIMNKAIATLNSGEGRRLYNKWMPVSYQHGISRKLVLTITLAGIVLIILMLMRNRRLTYLNKQINDAHHLLEEKSRELELLSTTDRLTGLYNRFKIDETFNYEWARVQRYEQSLSLIMLDLDYFKAVNDNHGHQQGDRVLCAIAESLQHRVRESDIVGRWGGEEFMIICPATSLSEAQILAEDLRIEIENIDLSPLPHQTASFGVATVLATDSQGDSFRRVDEALYRAKELGRNRVEVEAK